jgi:outer membrane beta-barrel protein
MRTGNAFLKVFAKWIAIGALMITAAPSGAQSGGKKGKATPAPTTPSAPPATPSKDDRVDISDIESKYWAPKDTDFSVVQNRTFPKEKRLAGSVQGGKLVNDNFNQGYSTNLSLNYFLTERFGAQLDYTLSDYHDSSATRGFIDQGGSPNYGRTKSYYGIGANVVPFYAKMSAWGKKIIYFDMAITPTMGMTNYEGLTLDSGTRPKSAFTYGIDVTQWFFLYRFLAVRIDLRNRWFSEDVTIYNGPGEGTKLKTTNTNNTLLLFGITWFFY